MLVLVIEDEVDLATTVEYNLRADGFQVRLAHSGRQGLASATADFLAQPLDAEATRRAGVSMGCATTPDNTICRTRGVNIYLDVMLKGLERMIRAGEYNQERIEEWQKQTRIAYKLRRPQQQRIIISAAQEQPVDIETVALVVLRHTLEQRQLGRAQHHHHERALGGREARGNSSSKLPPAISYSHITALLIG